MQVRLITALLLVTVAGCTERLDENACTAGDWVGIGLSDGIVGAPPATAEARIKDCARFGISLDRAQYEQGRLRGQGFFCTPYGALEAALDRRGDISLCDPNDVATRSAYRIGSDYAEAVSNLRSAESGYQSALSRIDRIRLEIDQLSAAIYRAQTEEERQKLIDRARKRRFELESAFSDLASTRQRLATAQRDFDRASRQYDNLIAQLNQGYEMERRAAFEQARREQREFPIPQPERDPNEFPPLMPEGGQP